MKKTLTALYTEVSKKKRDPELCLILADALEEDGQEEKANHLRGIVEISSLPSGAVTGHELHVLYWAFMLWARCISPDMPEEVVLRNLCLRGFSRKNVKASGYSWKEGLDRLIAFTNEFSALTTADHTPVYNASGPYFVNHSPHYVCWLYRSLITSSDVYSVTAYTYQQEFSINWTASGPVVAATGLPLAVLDQCCHLVPLSIMAAIPPSK